MSLLQIGLDHRDGSLADLETLRAGMVAGAGSTDATVRLVPLITCHRVELYLEGDLTPPGAYDLFARFTGTPRAAQHPRPTLRSGEDAGRHLLRVAAGLESAVLGEDQVLGQVRAAYRSACAVGSPGPVLHRLFHAALRSGRLVRSHTELAHGHRSLAACGVAMLLERLGSDRPRRVLVLGAGEMAALAARRLAERGVEQVLIANRTRAHAERLASQVGAEVVPWAWRARKLVEVDGVVAAVGADRAILLPEDVVAASRRPGRPVLLDLGVPRNLPAVGDAALIDMEHLLAHVAGDAARRRAAVADAERIVAEELSQWWRWVLNRANLSPTGRRTEAASG